MICSGKIALAESVMIMEIEIRLYATLRDKIGERRITIELEEPFDVKNLTETVKAKYPIMSESVDSAVVSVNRAFATMDTPVNAGDEIAMFPPVSGG